jgi:2-methylcitrate dehydratase PrpD
MSVTEQVASFVETTQYEDLPAETIALARPLVLDSLGVSIAGAASPVGQIALKLGSETMDGNNATVIATDYSTSVSSAAFINGTLAHALDMDDTAANTIAHPSSSIVPALFALGEKYHLSGKSFLTAYILGLEVFYRISLASEGQMRGWHRTSLFGALATAAASAKLLGLSSEQIETAIGIATSFTGGVQLNFGTMTKAIQVGHASQNGVLAALLAKEGCTAHQNSLGDSLGFGFTFYSDKYDEHQIVSDFGNPYSIVFPGIAVKIHPCCGLTHAPADIALDLVKTHDIAADQVEDVVVYAEELSQQVLIHHRPKTGYQGKYSMEYVVAAAMIDREISFETFTDEKVNRPELQTCLEKVRLETRVDSEWAGIRTQPWGHCAEVTIRLRDGITHSGSAPCARGYPDLPLSSEEIVRKYTGCAAPVLQAEAVDTLTRKVLSLDAQNDVSDIIRLTRALNENR